MVLCIVIVTAGNPKQIVLHLFGCCGGILHSIVRSLIKVHSTICIRSKGTSEDVTPARLYIFGLLVIITIIISLLQCLKHLAFLLIGDTIYTPLKRLNNNFFNLKKSLAKGILFDHLSLGKGGKGMLLTNFCQRKIKF